MWKQHFLVDFAHVKGNSWSRYSNYNQYKWKRLLVERSTMINILLFLWFIDLVFWAFAVIVSPQIRWYQSNISSHRRVVLCQVKLWLIQLLKKPQLSLRLWKCNIITSVIKCGVTIFFKWMLVFCICCSPNLQRERSHSQFEASENSLAHTDKDLFGWVRSDCAHALVLLAMWLQWQFDSLWSTDSRQQ